ncbi:MFS transporter [Micromonospora sp. NPDC005806]|uniref:MFS transporter n=1 Tax=Micromonospora sp. NPDC005806 TaxID=3364234 RepID=UPI00367EEE9B
MQWFQQIAPPPGVARALTLRSIVYAAGSGIFQAGSAVFFTKYLGLTATQVGIGLSVAGALTVGCSIPLGVLTDRFGARRTWIVAGLAEAVLFFAYPLIGSFTAFLGLVCLLALTDMTGSTAKHVYTLQALPPAERVRALAYQRSALNVGFTAGAALSGIALAIGTRPAYLGLVLTNGAVLLLTAALISRLPKVPTAGSAPRTNPFAALADRPFLALSGVNGVLQAHVTLFGVVLPLWILTQTDAPELLVPVLYMVNTVLAVTLQVRASRGSETPLGAARALRTGGVTVALSALLLGAAAFTSGVITIAVLVAGTVMLTIGELTQSAGAWGITATLPPEDRRGEYTGAFKLGGQLQQSLGPAGLTMLAIGTGGWGWLVIAVLMLVGGYYAPAAVRWVLRTPRLGATIAADPAPELARVR